MSDQRQPITPSLGESVIERMHKLNIEEDKKSQLPRMTTHSKANAQDYTPRPDSIPSYEALRTSSSDEENNEHLNPRRAPIAPHKTPSRTQSVSKIGRRTSLKALNVLKVRKAVSKADIVTPQQSQRKMQRNSINERPQSVSKGASTPSSIPRPTRSTGKRTSASAELSPTSPKLVTLKRAQGQITDLMNVNKASNDVKEAQSDDMKGSTQSRPRSSIYVDDEAEETRRPSTRQSDATVFSSWAMRDPDSPDKKSSNGSDSSATTIHYELHASPIDTPRKSSHKEIVQFKNEDDEEDEGLSPIKNFKFPASPEKGDDQSTLTRTTSFSSVSKAGTVYAEDENGPYRLKPISNANPKNGPQVRIDHSADKLFLTDEGLADVVAKREVYEKKTRSIRVSSEEKPELASLRLVNEDTAPALKMSAENSSIPPTWLHKAHDSASRLNDRLAPSVPSDIPNLTHSPTGWPLYVSKIAPFAEIDQTSPKRKSLSESDLKVPSTPQHNRLSVVDEAPASAYTIRTALAQLDRENNEVNPSSKVRKSLPDIPPSETIVLPIRTNPKEHPAVKRQSSSKHVNGLRKQTSDILKSYVSQRAHAKPTTPSAQFMHSYNSSSRYNSRDSSPNLPSSPPISSGTVPSGKAKMMNHVKELFHKTSREVGLTHKSSRSSAFHSSRKSSPLVPSPSTSEVKAQQKVNISRIASIRQKTQRMQEAPKADEPFMTSALEPAEIRDATALAFKLLDKARASDLRRDGKQHNVDEVRIAEKQREEYVELARGIVAIVTLARDAEKAMEEAKAAAAKAEIEVVRCRENVGDVCGIVEKMLK